MTNVDGGTDADGAQLARLYQEAVRDLNRHWPGEDGTCIGCGDAYPCAEEWITERAIIGIETRWRRVSLRLAEAREAQDPAAQDAAGNPNEED